MCLCSILSGAYTCIFCVQVRKGREIMLSNASVSPIIRNKRRKTSPVFEFPDSECSDSCVSDKDSYDGLRTPVRFSDSSQHSTKQKGRRRNIKNSKGMSPMVGMSPEARRMKKDDPCIPYKKAVLRTPSPSLAQCEKPWKLRDFTSCETQNIEDLLSKQVINFIARLRFKGVDKFHGKSYIDAHFRDISDRIVFDICPDSLGWVCRACGTELLQGQTKSVFDASRVTRHLERATHIECMASKTIKLACAQSTFMTCSSTEFVTHGNNRLTQESLNFIMAYGATEKSYEPEDRRHSPACIKAKSIYRAVLKVTGFSALGASQVFQQINRYVVENIATASYTNMNVISGQFFFPGTCSCVGTTSKVLLKSRSE
jgi:hypothetical protein